jgi:hypothetical protein
MVVTVVTIAALGVGLRPTSTAQVPRLEASTDPSTAVPETASAVIQPAISTPTTSATGGPSAVATAPGVAAGAPKVPNAPKAPKAPNVPGALSNVVAFGGARKVTVSWRFTPGTASRLHVRLIGNSDILTNATCTATSGSCTFKGLTGGVKYTAEVSVMQGSTELTRRTATAIPYPEVLQGAHTRLWLDTAHPGSIQTPDGKLSSGETVTRILDRSGNGGDASALAGWKSPTVSHVNGLTALGFSGSQALTFAADALPTGSSHSTVYAVAPLQDSSAATDCFRSVIQWGAQSTNQARLLLKGCGTDLAFADTYDTWADAAPTKPWRAGRVQVVRADFSQHQLAVWVDGASSYTWHQTASMSTGSGVGVLGGTVWDTGSGWKGSIAEVIVLSSTPTAAEDDAIVSYLKHKWVP